MNIDYYKDKTCAEVGRFVVDAIIAEEQISYAQIAVMLSLCSDFPREKKMPPLFSKGIKIEGFTDFPIQKEK